MICNGCNKAYTPDCGDKGWCKFCQYLFAWMNIIKRQKNSLSSR